MREKIEKGLTINEFHGYSLAKAYHQFLANIYFIIRSIN